MASSSKSSGKSKRSTQLVNSDTDDCQESTSFKGSIKGKRLKKEDSGINVIQESVSSDEIDSPIKNISPERKGDGSPDSGNNDENCGFEDLKHYSKLDTTSEISSTVNEGASSSGNQSIEDNPKPTENSDKDFKNFTRRTNQKGSDSDSDHSSDKHDSSSDSNDSYDRANSSCDSDQLFDNMNPRVEKPDNQYDPTPQTPKPKHKWVVPFAVTERQYGFSQKYSADNFRFKAYGSLHVVERLELMDKMKKHDGCVNALNFNSNGTKLVSGSDDLDIIVWDWTIGEPILDYNSGHRSNVFQAKFMPLGQDCFIVSCGRDGQVRVGELSLSGECKKTRKLAQHKGAAHKLALQMDSPHTFLSCGEDAAVYGIDLREEKPEKLVICKEKDKKVPLFSIYVNPLKSFEYIVGGKNSFVKVYDTRFIQENAGFLKNLCPEHLKQDDAKNVTSVVYNYNGSEILASYNDEDIYSFDMRETDCSKYLHRYRGHKNSQTVKGVNYFGSKSEYVVSGSDCGYIFFWDRDSEHVVKYMYGDEGGVVNCLEPNPIMPVLATSGLDDDIKIWVPSCEVPPDLSGLRKHLIANMREREEERSNCPEAFIDQTIWFLMQHLTRSRRRSQLDERNIQERNIHTLELSSSSDSESPDEDGPLRHQVQCNQS